MLFDRIKDRAKYAIKDRAKRAPKSAPKSKGASRVRAGARLACGVYPATLAKQATQAHVRAYTAIIVHPLQCRPS